MAETTAKQPSHLKNLIDAGVVEIGPFGPTFCQSVTCGRVVMSKGWDKQPGKHMVELEGMGGKRMEFIESTNPLAVVPVGHIAIIRRGAEMVQRETAAGKSRASLRETFGDPVLIDALDPKHLPTA